jgi:hypothetical protein
VQRDGVPLARLAIEKLRNPPSERDRLRRIEHERRCWLVAPAGGHDQRDRECAHVKGACSCELLSGAIFLRCYFPSALVNAVIALVALLQPA